MRPDPPWDLAEDDGGWHSPGVLRDLSPYSGRHGTPLERRSEWLNCHPNRRTPHPTRVLYGVSMLQDACLTYLAAAVPYRLETLPYDVTDTHLTFDGYQLTLTHQRYDEGRTLSTSTSRCARSRWSTSPCPPTTGSPWPWWSGVACYGCLSRPG